MSIKEIIASRKTSKVLAKSPLEDDFDKVLLESLVHAAAYAPFHYSASSIHREKLPDQAPEPWRIYVLDRTICREVRKWLIGQNEKSKIPEMLAAADMLLQITWCPTREDEATGSNEFEEFEASQTNMEHIAATASAIQNIILVATENEIPSYWSSGGPLRKKETFDLLGIPHDEILLGAVFFFPRNIDQNQKVTTFPGKLHDRRSFGRTWCQWIKELNTSSNKTTTLKVDAIVRMGRNSKSPHKY
ncbi:MAG: nitroreductase family protein [Gammaproteobacteria bacterium]|nr:nitroreductase family protein [Gammaproteobacteria bacterium]MCY4218818.1 nitroreductase family protein [Gammaproteobacteria bacterium]MCY4275320.1 nitroreductase family protein [Gammaproteobacteria bacterium]